MSIFKIYFIPRCIGEFALTNHSDKHQFKAIFIVPIAPMASSVRKNRPISSGVSVRSRGLNMAIDEGLMSAAGLNKP